MKMIDLLIDWIWAVFMLPMYGLSLLWWRYSYGKWVFANFMAYGRAASRSLLACFLNWLLWIVLVGVPFIIWST